MASQADDPLSVARQELEPGETLVWADRPRPEALARTKLPQVIRGALGLAVIAGLHWYGYVPDFRASAENALMFAFLVAAGLYCLALVVAPQIAKASAGRMVYAVTSRRVMILSLWPLRSRRIFLPAELDEPRALADASGEGAVVFIERKLPWWKRSAGGSYQIEAFYGIADAPRVAAEIARLRDPAEVSPFDNED
ncbi:hypothetical protein [Pelagibius sp.]|uniref:hypothetical protein n=1 Tax=Pelagibius sp. TaxID=1931238 RepID=UPI00262F890D|nr:hypothetical protein [Pelagibius sp.]